MATVEELQLELTKFTIQSEIISITDVKLDIIYEKRDHLLLKDGKCEKCNMLLKPKKLK